MNDKAEDRTDLARIAHALVAHCRAGTELQGLDELYDEEAVSIEAFDAGGDMPRKAKGLDAIKGKHAWWNGAFEVTRNVVEGPFLHGDKRFAVIFDMSARNRQTGEEMSMKEVAIYTVDDGKIEKEMFFNMAPA